MWLQAAAETCTRSAASSPRAPPLGSPPGPLLLGFFGLPWVLGLGPFWLSLGLSCSSGFPLPGRPSGLLLVPGCRGWRPPAFAGGPSLGSLGGLGLSARAASVRAWVPLPLSPWAGLVSRSPWVGPLGRRTKGYQKERTEAQHHQCIGSTCIIMVMMHHDFASRSCIMTMHRDDES